MLKISLSTRGSPMPSDYAKSLIFIDFVNFRCRTDVVGRKKEKRKEREKGRKVGEKGRGEKGRKKDERWKKEEERKGKGRKLHPKTGKALKSEKWINYWEISCT